ncbi:YfiR family protein [Thiorhodococcus minor]|uniref:YfiR family protein n=1 Tax=Thiorhodococcus minor TaxID=57489 RepID=A0A6M0JY38_9GAMM|nr:YfiR family protein [Thiorhodococcus minor]NEV62436.1 YfiR family protein [Thiorhodococcus minor]
MPPLRTVSPTQTAGPSVPRLLPSLLLALLLIADVRCFGADESEVEVAYLYNFSKFVDWPADRLRSRSDSLLVCVYGRASIGPAIASIDGKRARGHRLRVIERARGESLRACHIVYVAASEEPYLAPVLRSLAGEGVLTVSRIPGFAANGGIIGFVAQERRLRFEINLARAQASGLYISSQLLQLATRVIRE